MYMPLSNYSGDNGEVPSSRRYGGTMPRDLPKDMSLAVKTRDGKPWGTDDKGHEAEENNGG